MISGSARKRPDLARKRAELLIKPPRYPVRTAQA
jgi:hypothetical protein